MAEATSTTKKEIADLFDRVGLFVERLEGHASILQGIVNDLPAEYSDTANQLSAHSALAQYFAKEMQEIHDAGQGALVMVNTQGGVEVRHG